MAHYSGRNKEYIEYTIRHAMAVARLGMVVRFFPKILKGLYLKSFISDIRLATRLLFPDANRGENIIYKHLAPIIEERRRLQVKGEPKKVIKSPNLD